MNTNQRQDKILDMLLTATLPVSASRFATLFGVSRQVIVGDIALLRAKGENVISTSKGYLIKSSPSIFDFVGIIACKHKNDDIYEELSTIVNLGGHILDVVVSHEIYGDIKCTLDIATIDDVDAFCKNIKEAKPLSSLNHGIHIHKVGCNSETDFLAIKKKLGEKKFLL